jgi:hypothetical protein
MVMWPKDSDDGEDDEESKSDEKITDKDEGEKER